jgi:hypothetical protein
MLFNADIRIQHRKTNRKLCKMKKISQYLRLLGGLAHRVVGLRPSSTPLDTPAIRLCYLPVLAAGVAGIRSQLWFPDGHSPRTPGRRLVPFRCGAREVSIKEHRNRKHWKISVSPIH